MLALYDLAPPDKVRRWLVTRLAAYFMIALLVGQAFIGIAGFGQGGEWITAAVACELFCALWIASHFGGLSRLRLPLFVPTYSNALDSRESNSAPQSDLMSPSTRTPPTIEISADVDAYLTHILEGSLDAGTLFLARSQDRIVSKVLLSPDEYELLRAAAALAHNPDRLASLQLPREGSLKSFEEVFGHRE
jgi:hypothetical protein